MKFISFIFILYFFSQHIQAQNSGTVYLSLDEALELGLNNNFNIQISEADVKIATNNNTLGNAGMLPTVSVGIAQSNRYDNAESRSLPDERDEIWSNTLRPNANVQMILFNGFRIKTNKHNLELAQEMAQTELRGTIENSVSEIINAYYAVLLEQERLNILANLKTLSKDRYDYVQLRRSIGSAVTYDVLQVKNAFLQDSANYLSQQSAYNTAMRRLNKALSDTSFTNYTLTDELSSETYDFSLSELEQQLIEQNAHLQTMRTGQEITENYIKIAESTRYPSLALNAGSNYTHTWAKYGQTNYNASYSYDIYANLSLSYTIFDGGNRKRQIANAQIEYEKIHWQISDFELSLKSSLYSLYDMYEVRKQILSVALENIEAAELNLQISKEKFENGTINSFNYRDVQLNYLNAAFTKLQAEYNLTATHTDILKITGNLVNNHQQ